MRLLNLIKSLRISTSIYANRAYSDYTPKALRSLKTKSSRQSVQFYLDTFRIRAVAGNGRDGCISFLSAWCKDHAGPDGSDAGSGGYIIFQATHAVKSLNHCKSVTLAKHGERGYNKGCTGKNAQHVIVPVPLGTIVKDSSGQVVGDLSREGVMFVAARGGAGGRGNQFFLTDTEQRTQTDTTAASMPGSAPMPETEPVPEPESLPEPALTIELDCSLAETTLAATAPADVPKPPPQLAATRRRSYTSHAADVPQWAIQIEERHLANEERILCSLKAMAATSAAIQHSVERIEEKLLLG